MGAKSINKSEWVGTKAQYLALSVKVPGRKYHIVDLETLLITNAAMTLALSSAKSLYKHKDVFLCCDNGTYKEWTYYQFVEASDGAVSWQEIRLQDYVTLTTEQAISGKKTFSNEMIVSNISPRANNQYNLGSSSSQFNSIYGATLYENGTSLFDKYVSRVNNLGKSTQVYASGNNGEEMITTANAPAVSGIPRYDTNKNIKSSTPVADNDVTIKSYVDTADSNLRTYIDTTDSATRKFVTDNYLPLIGGTITGNLTIKGNITQEGENYITHAEHVKSTKDYIYLREGNTGGLASGSYSGFEFIKYDGTNNGRLVVDNKGVARVGDVGDEQPLATREETPTSFGLTYWDNNNTRLSTISAGTSGYILKSNGSAAPAWINPTTSLTAYKTSKALTLQSSASATTTFDGSTARTLSDYYVDKFTAQEISGIKTFNNQTYHKSSIRWDIPSYDQYNAPGSTGYKVINWFYDKNNKNVGVQHLAFLSDGNIEHQIDVRRDINNTGTNSFAILKVGMKADGTAYTSAPTPAASSNNSNIATTKWTNDKLISYTKLDGSNYYVQLAQPSDNNNAAGWRLISELDPVLPAWGYGMLSLAIESRHSGTGLLTVCICDVNGSIDSIDASIRFYGSTDSTMYADAFKLIYNKSTGAGKLYWRFSDYNWCKIKVLGRNRFTLPSNNGAWLSSVPTAGDNEIEFIPIKYDKEYVTLDTAQTITGKKTFSSTSGEAKLTISCPNSANQAISFVSNGTEHSIIRGNTSKTLVHQSAAHYFRNYENDLTGFVITSGSAVHPETANCLDIGTSSKKFNKGFFNTSVNIGSCTMQYNTSTASIDFVF